MKKLEFDHFYRYGYSLDEDQFILIRGLDCNVPCSDIHGMCAGLSTQTHHQRYVCEMCYCNYDMLAIACRQPLLNSMQ